jgi:cell division protein FtsW (lipid II flippase)
MITFFLFVYTLSAFATFLYKQRNRRKWLYVLQIISMFAVQIACFIQILARTGRMQYVFFFAFQFIIFASAIMLFYIIYPDGNKLIFNNSCMLMIIGMIILTRLSYNKSIKQFFVITASFVIGFFVPELIFRLNLLKKFSWVYAAVGIAAVGVVLILGAATNGSKISYTVAGITFQPSEFVKILFLFFMASALYSADSIWQLLYTSFIAAVHVIILVLSKDLGSALIFFIIYLALIYISTENIGYLILGTSFGILASAIAYRLFGHIQVRVQAWLDPFVDIEASGYQISQSLFGISSGGWFGLGLYGGSPQSIPYVEQDFIFSAIAEEMGVIFSVLMTLICVCTFVAMMQEGYYLKDKFYRYLVTGVGIAYIFQTFLTIGGGTKFIPLTGVTLPFVSYGGTSILTTMIMIMIAEGVSMIRVDERYVAIENKRKKLEARRRAEEQNQVTGIK